jgi:hypothetical protein
MFRFGRSPRGRLTLIIEMPASKCGRPLSLINFD